MTSVSCDVLVIGAGVVGLAVAKRFAEGGFQTILIDKNSRYGSETSSRSSEVIHAGLYYAEDSLKAELCISGRELLYAYCERKGVPTKSIGKYVVAPTRNEMAKLVELYQRAQDNGAHEVTLLDSKKLSAVKGALNCVGVLESPKTGILDSHSLMTALLCDFEQNGGVAAWQTSALGYSHDVSAVSINIGEDNIVQAQLVINSSGHNATLFLPQHLSSIYTSSFAKGSYFRYTDHIPFDRLVYPVPGDDGLGIHLTFDLNGRARFGPDFERVSGLFYDVNFEKRRYSTKRYPDIGQLA